MSKGSEAGLENLLMKEVGIKGSGNTIKCMGREPTLIAKMGLLMWETFSKE